MNLLDVGAAGIRAVAQDHLLQEHERALVVHVLPHLQYSEDGRYEANTGRTHTVVHLLAIGCAPYEVWIAVWGLTELWLLRKGTLC